jgi:DNA-directed RNA polymerase specialized sigma24 family protein
MQTELYALRNGELAFDAFAHSTRNEWQKIARTQLARYKVPPAVVTLDDMVQELLMSCWKCVGEWNPDRGYQLKAFVLYRAIKDALRWLHAQRGAGKHHGDRMPSIIPVYGDLPIVVIDAEQDPTVDMLRSYERVLAGCDRRQRIVVQAFAQTGSVCGAEAMLHADAALWAQLGVSTRVQGRRVIRRALRQTAHRLDAEQKERVEQ